VGRGLAAPKNPVPCIGRSGFRLRPFESW